MMKYKPIESEIFHIHTYRCKHAGDEPDEAYVEKAISLGAKRITFTDHAPFPGNPFTHRMDYEDLEGYVSSLRSLGDKYSDDIEVIVGLEIEYLPSFESYYQTLRKDFGVDILLMGQHMFEISPGKYSFSYKNLWFPDIAETVIDGVKTGYFDGVAHPDRVFKKERLWTDKMQEISENIIHEAGKRAMFLEQNEESKRTEYYYWPQFWKVAEKMKNDFDTELIIIRGLDAHSTKEMTVLQ